MPCLGQMTFAHENIAERIVQSRAITLIDGVLERLAKAVSRRTERFILCTQSTEKDPTPDIFGIDLRSSGEIFKRLGWLERQRQPACLAELLGDGFARFGQLRFGQRGPLARGLAKTAFADQIGNRPLARIV